MNKENNEIYPNAPQPAFHPEPNLPSQSTLNERLPTPETRRPPTPITTAACSAQPTGQPRPGTTPPGASHHATRPARGYSAATHDPAAS